MIESTDYNKIGDLIVDKLEKTLPFVRFSYEYDIIGSMTIRIRADFFGHGERKSLTYQTSLLWFRDDCIEPICKNVASFMCQKIIKEFNEKLDPDTDSLIFKMEVPK